jgi:hypothetical protein
MAKEPDYIIYRRQANPLEAPKRAAQPVSDKVFPMTPGLWQQETLDTLGMYSEHEGGFSAVQGTLFPMEQVGRTKTAAPLNLDDPTLPVAHKSNFRFLSQDTLRYVQQAKLSYVDAAPPTHPPDAVALTGGKLYDPTHTEIKADQFPGRVHYTEGGLYPKGAKNDPKVIAQHIHAPNYRKMPGKPVHGVGQPTKQGFRDVADHLNGKNKPVVWTNTRSEGVIYINGEPHNLRELASHENLPLREGATGAELEALERKLRDQLIARGSLEVVDEVVTQGADGKPVTERRTRQVAVTAENCQTTEDVIAEMKADGYKIEYRRVPVPDEKSPDAAQLDDMRNFMSEMQQKYPDQDLQYVFNCHQGRGRTTTGMVGAGIALDGQVRQLELPFGIKLRGEDPHARADRIINDNFHMQNLRETVDEYKDKAAKEARRAEELRQKAEAESNAEKKAELQAEAAAAERKKTKYDTNACDFTKRYAMMQKYSEYIAEHGAHAQTPSFQEWIQGSAQEHDLQVKWVALNEQFGLATPQTALA